MTSFLLLNHLLENADIVGLRNLDCEEFCRVISEKEAVERERKRQRREERHSRRGDCRMFYLFSHTKNHGGHCLTVDFRGVRLKSLHPATGSHQQPPLNMSRDSQSPFSQSVRNAFRDTYGNRCVLCLHYLPPGGAHSAHLIDQSSTTGREQVRINSNINMFQGTKHIFSARGGSAFGSLASGLSKEVNRQWVFVYVKFFLLSTVHLLTRQHSMPYVSLVLFHSKSHCFFPLFTRTSVHQRLPQPDISG